MVTGQELTYVIFRVNVLHGTIFHQPEPTELGREIRIHLGRLQLLRFWYVYSYFQPGFNHQQCFCNAKLTNVS
jgi:hypothetical protein